LDSLDSVRRELTEKIRSKSSRLWKALTRVDEEEEEDVVEVEEEEEEEEEEKISTVPSISPAEALAQSILQERGEIKIDDVEEDKNDMIDGQLPKSILETYVMNFVVYTIDSTTHTHTHTGTDNTLSVQVVENVVTRPKNRKRRTSHHHHHHHHKKRKHFNRLTMTIWHLNMGPLQHQHYY